MDVLGIDAREGWWNVVHLKAGARGLRAVNHFTLGERTSEERLASLRAYCGHRKVRRPRVGVSLEPGRAVAKTLTLKAPSQDALHGIAGFETDRHTPFERADARYSVDLLKRDGQDFTILLSASDDSAVESVERAFAGVGFKAVLPMAPQAALLEGLSWSGIIGPGRQSIVVWADGPAAAVAACDGGVPLCLRQVGCSERRAAIAGVIAAEVRSVMRQRRSSERPTEVLLLTEECPPGFIEALSAGIAHGVKRGALRRAELGSQYLPALGAAVAASGSGGYACGLTRSAGRSGPQKRPLALRLAAASLALFAVLLVSFAARDYIALSRLDAAVEEARARAENARAMAEDMAEDRDGVSALASMRGTGQDGASAVLRELTLLVPADSWLTGLEYAGGRVSIEGVSRSASALFLRLEGSGYFDAPEFGGPVTKGPGGERFKVSFTLKEGTRGVPHTRGALARPQGA